MVPRLPLLVLVSLALIAFSLAVAGPSQAATPPDVAPAECDVLAYGRSAGVIATIPGGGGTVTDVSGLGGDMIAAQPHWRRFGRQLAWTAEVPPFGFASRTIVTADADGTNHQIFDLTGLAGFGGQVLEPTWSPDGSRLAFFAVGNGGPRVGFVDRGGTNAAWLKDSGVAPFGLAWSPDGEFITWTTLPDFTVSAVDGSGDIDLIGPGADPDPIENLFLRWSADGTRITWSGMLDGHRGIFVARADGTERLAITNAGDGSADNAAPSFSPDGTRVAWVGQLDGSWRLFTAAIDGTDRRVLADLTSHVPELPAPVWSPDGRRIALVEHMPGPPDNRLVVADVESGTHSAISGATLLSADWQPRASDLELSIELEAQPQQRVGDLATVRLDVTSPCGAGNVAVALTVPPCASIDVDNASMSAGDLGPFAGVFASTVWQLDNVHGAESLELPLVSTDTGLCEITVRVVQAFPALRLDVDPVGATLDAARVCDVSVMPFVDVDADSFAFDDIACIYGLGITTGTSPTTYSPTEPVTREQMAAFQARLYRDLRGDTCPEDPHPFIDVDENSFAFEDIACIYNLGVTTGTSPTTFDPARILNREEMAAFLARMWLALGNFCPPGPGPVEGFDTSTPFTDVDPDSFAFDDIACIYHLEVTTGTSPTTYSPDEPVDREQMAAFVSRIWHRATLQPG